MSVLISLIIFLAGYLIGGTITGGIIFMIVERRNRYYVDKKSR